jgi:hypothetical protein
MVKLKGLLEPGRAQQAVMVRPNIAGRENTASV